MAGKLTTHVLDTAAGQPAAGVPITVVRVADGAEVARAVTNADGRTEAPLLEGEHLDGEVYELRFEVGSYFTGREGVSPAPFLDIVPVRFRADGSSHYHVPLLVSPWAYSTYRGS
ncbi:MAG: hydroxyisourate hydrolase [Gaiella sp.]